MAAVASASQRWIEVCAVSELAVGEARVVACEGRDILLVRASDHEVFAIDHLCPHDGLPLSHGSIEGGRVTCVGDHDAYELKTGVCLRGDEDTVSYPVRVSGEQLEVAIAKTSPEAVLELRAKSLKEALVNGRLSQAARDIARMLQAGIDASRIVLEIAAYDAAHNEHGAGDALAVAADTLRVAPRYLGGEATLPLLLLAQVALDASKYRGPRKVPASQDPGREPDGVGARLLGLLDKGDAEAADGLVRGALWRKWTREQIEPWFYELNVAHLLGTGSGLVHTTKAFALLESLGFEHARRILPGLTHALVVLPRDDARPEFQWFRQRFAQLEPRLEELWNRSGQRVLSDEERYGVARAVLDGSREEAWHAVIGAWVSGARVRCVIDALSRAAAERMWRFDTATDRDPAESEGFGEVIQAFEYVHALRNVSRRYEKSGLLKMVLYGVRMVNALKVLDMPADRWTAVDAKGRASFVDRERFLVDMVDMIRERESVAAQRAGLAYLQLGGSLDALRATLYDVVLRGRFTDSRWSGRALGLSVAVCDEAMHLPESERGWPVRAFLRFLASPVCELSLDRMARQARSVVELGRPPKSRLSSD